MTSFDQAAYNILWSNNEVFALPMYSDILKELRKDKKITQVQMAEMMGISQSSYSDYENGVRDMPLLMLDYLADILGTSTDYILGRTDVMKPYPKRNSGNK